MEIILFLLVNCIIGSITIFIKFDELTLADIICSIFCGFLFLGACIIEYLNGIVIFKK